MYWIAYQVVGDAEEAKDVVQTVFVRLWKALAKYDPRYPFSTWLYRMVMNLAIDHLRREARHRHAAGHAAKLGQPAGDCVSVARVRRRGTARSRPRYRD